MFRIFFVLLFCAGCIASVCLGAGEASILSPQQAMLSGDPPPITAPTVVQELVAITSLALLPFAVLLLTSYTKIVVVLALLRNAIGVQQAPPNQVLNGIAILMTLFVMFPTGYTMYKLGEEYMSKQPPAAFFSSQSAKNLVAVVELVKEPMREFLLKNSTGGTLASFFQLAHHALPEAFRASLKETDYIVLVPTFITSQLKASFEIGVLIYLPFFVIDLVTSNILLAMGMMMLSPLTIALPLKLLLFVMVDGWTLIINGLVLSFR
jgi:type III secretion protein R